MYISWAAYYEGRSDASYFNVLIPRCIEAILLAEGVRPYEIGDAPAVEFGISERDFDTAALSICRRLNEFHVLVIHADMGGRGQRGSIAGRREALVERATAICGLDRRIVAFLSPVKELEAWALADRDAVLRAFGLQRLPQGLLEERPRFVEQYEDPKLVLKSIAGFSGRRREGMEGILVRIAQEQDLDILIQVPSFFDFHSSLRTSLSNIGAFG